MSEPDVEWSPVALEELPKGARKKTSSVWNFCDIINEQYALCTICNHKLSYKSSVTNLRKHFKKKHPDVAMPSHQQYIRNKRARKESDDEMNETQRATNSVIVDYLRPAGDDSRPKFRSTMSFSKYAAQVKRERSSPERSDCRFKRSHPEETEFELFGRTIIMQLQQLPLVHALEVQAEITNLIVQKRIQALRQSNQTNTEETPMQYALVYTSEPHPSQHNGEEIAVDKETSATAEEIVPVSS